VASFSEVNQAEGRGEKKEKKDKKNTINYETLLQVSGDLVT